MSDIEVIKKEIEEQILNTSDLKALDEVRVNALGKKGRITELLKTLGGLPIEERIEFGKKIVRNQCILYMITHEMGD